MPEMSGLGTRAGGRAVLLPSNHEQSDGGQAGMAREVRVKGQKELVKTTRDENLNFRLDTISHCLLGAA